MQMSVGSGSGARMGSARVLVVDDSRLIRALVMSCLRKTGCSIDEASDGEAALRLCGTRDYDVVVSDVAMPGLDGFGLLRALEHRPDRPEVVLLTASSDLLRESALRGISLSAHECLSKPPKAPDTVVMAVERALRKKRVREHAQGGLPSPLLKAAMAS